MEVEEALEELEKIRIKNYYKFKNKRYVLSYLELIGFTINTLKLIIDYKKGNNEEKKEND